MAIKRNKVDLKMFVVSLLRWTLLYFGVTDLTSTAGVRGGVLGRGGHQCRGGHQGRLRQPPCLSHVLNHYSGLQIYVRLSRCFLLFCSVS